MKRPVFLSAVLAALAASSTARANESYTTYTNGFPIGEKSRVHAGIELGAAYDTNPDRLETSAAQPQWLALTRPGILIDVPGNTVNGSLLGQLTVLQYFSNSNASSQTNFGGLGQAQFHAGSPESVVAFDLSDQLVRTPAYLDDIGSVPSEERRLALWYNHGNAGFTFKPGGGALSIVAHYMNSLAFYDAAGLGTSQTHGGMLEGRIRFLPKTELVLHGDFSVFTVHGGNNGTKDATPYNAWLGLIGLVTSRLSVNLHAGFADTLSWSSGLLSSVNTDNTRTFIALAELTYEFYRGGRLTLGYMRSTAPIVVLDSYISNMGYARLLFGLSSRLTFSAFGEADHRNYAINGQTANIFTADARFDYWFFDFLTAGIDYRLLKQVTGDAAAGQTPLLDAYTRQQIFLVAGLRY